MVNMSRERVFEYFDSLGYIYPFGNVFFSSIMGITIHGVGRNLSYKKELFFKVKGFANHMHIISGDDDLFIKEAANKKILLFV